MEGETFLCFSRKEVATQGKEERNFEVKRKGFGDGPLLDSFWDNWDGRQHHAPDPDPDYGSGSGGSSAFSSWQWRPKNR